VHSFAGDLQVRRRLTHAGTHCRCGDYEASSSRGKRRGLTIGIIFKRHVPQRDRLVSGAGLPASKPAPRKFTNLVEATMRSPTAQVFSAEKAYPHPVPLIRPVMREPVMRPIISASPFWLVASNDPSGATATEKVGERE
jgi:hypothetical protein